MTVNISQLESVIQTKMDSLTSGSDSKEVIYLAKALESLDNGTLSSVGTYASLPVAAQSTGRVIYVADAQKIYYSNGSAWVLLSTAQDPNFSISTVGIEFLETEDYDLISNAVVESEDWDLITTAVSSAVDNFQLSLVNKGTQGDIYIDPTWFTFTVYDGVTRAGVKHLGAHRNNLDFENMTANYQGLVHLTKSEHTLIPLGTPTPIPFNTARILDTRLGSFTGGYFVTNYEGWYKVLVSAWTDGDVYLFLGGSNSPIDNFTGSPPENIVVMNRVIYLQKYETLRLIGMCDGIGVTVNRTVYGYDYNHPNLTQMTIEYLGK
jgi:hypothetical protein